MTPKEKAKELVEKFKDHVNPYIGSGMLSNTHDDGAILWQSKKCAMIAVDEILLLQSKIINDEDTGDGDYWQEVKEEISKL